MERQAVIAIVGRPNVGKSTLFNRLVKQRKAIVGDRPGVTVDRLEADCPLGERMITLVDTGGIGETPHGDMQAAIDAQVEAALDVADVVLFIVDGQAGMTPVDEMIAAKLRCLKRPLVLAVNKAEHVDTALEFYALGLDDPRPVSAIHGQGIRELQQHLDAVAPKWESDTVSVTPMARIAVMGRPNVGKSTLINAWLGCERMVVSPVAGTTRDAVDIDMPYKDGVIRLVDTAGQRRHSRISDVIEFVARVKAQQAFRRADTAVMLLDGNEGIVEQDMRLMSLAHDSGCGLVVAVNKVDVLTKESWEHYSERLAFRMRALTDIPVLRVSAKTGQGVQKLLNESVQAGHRNRSELSTGVLNRWLEQAQEMHRIPCDHGAAVRMKYCAQVAYRPPTIRVFCNRPKGINQSYIRFLEQNFRKTFKLPGVPVRFLFTATDNPYAKV